MKQKKKYVLRGLANRLGLKVKYVSYFADNVHGVLLVREKRILINAHKPRYEHIFTLLHELGHYLQHHLNRNRQRHPRIFDVQIEWDFWSKISSHARRIFRFHFLHGKGKEWEADLWAMCTFVYLIKVIDCRDELITFLDHHPEKTGIFWLAVWGNVYGGLKTRVKNLLRAIQKPFQAI